MDTVIHSTEKPAIWHYGNPLHLWGTLWKNRVLIVQLTKREVSARYKATNLGLIWPVLTPLIMLAVYTYVFGYVFKARWSLSGTDSRIAFSLTLFCGFLLYNVFSETIINASNVVVQNPNYVKKVVFPVEVLPVVSFLASLFHGSLSFCILLIGIFAFLGWPSWTMLFFPFALLPLCALTLGVAWLISALGVFIRDISQSVTIFIQILIFATPIFYSIEIVPENLRWVLYINPLTQIVQDARRTLLWHQLPDWPTWWLFTAFSLGIAQVGYMVFMRSKRAFGDVI